MATLDKTVLYYNLDEKILTPYLSIVENLLFTVDKIILKKTDTLKDIKADLVIVYSPLGGDQLIRWVKKLIDERTLESIWIPMIFIVEDNLSDVGPLVRQCISNTNWYFDIINKDNLDFLPMRIALFLKISDHLKEILEYDTKIQELSLKVEELEAKLKLLS